VSATIQEPPAAQAGPRGGGGPARRAVIRWAVRLLRHEWRQQLLILALITAAVAATFIASAVATTTPASPAGTLGTAQYAVTFPGATTRAAADIAAIRQHFGRLDVIETGSRAVPGSVATFSLRAQDPHGAFGQPLLSLVRGQYPSGAGQVAMTSGLAADFHLSVGSTWTFGGVSRKVTGIVEDPLSLVDEFALVPPGQVTNPDSVRVLFDAPGVTDDQVSSLLPGSPQVISAGTLANDNVINPETISLTAATLGMLLIALVGIGGFTVLAQRRLRSIGMLAAQGATERNIRLVVRANGLATGVAGAVAGFCIGLVGWLIYRPTAQASAHHVIGAFQLPWTVIGTSMLLAILAAYVAASRPAKAISRVPVVAALSGRPPAPKQTGRLAVPVGTAFLVAAFLLLGVAGATPGNGGGQSKGMGALVLGFIAMTVAIAALSPACLGLVARLGGRSPVAVRLALRDLARYRARSGPALAAISVSTLIAVLICVATAARFGNVLDYAGPNLAPNQLAVYTPAGPYGGLAQLSPPSQANPDGPSADGPSASGTSPSGTSASGTSPSGTAGKPHDGAAKERPAARPSAAQVAAVQGIAKSLGAGAPITLETTTAHLNHAAPGRSWAGPVYVATPQLLGAFGISASQVHPDALILTMRPGLDTMPLMQLDYDNGSAAAQAAQQAGSRNPDPFACPPATCVARPPIQEASALPSGTSAPNTVITEHAIAALGLGSRIVTSGWLIQAPAALTQAQIASARQAAGAAGLSIETRNSIPSLSTIVNDATIFGIVLALGILAMSVGLVRSEAARDLRTLSATGASGRTRRTLVATTAVALALTGAVIGLAGGYLAAIGFFRSNSLDGLSSLSSIPVANLLLILIAMPLLAGVAGWLLAGREPRSIARQPLE
jgi:putative ABC transport system permease protein